jgi:hypothetical protein
VSARKPSATPASHAGSGNTLDDVTTYLQSAYPEMSGNVQVVIKPATGAEQGGGAAAPSTAAAVSYHHIQAHKKQGTMGAAVSAGLMQAVQPGSSAGGGGGGAASSSMEVDEPADVQWPASTSILCHHCAHAFDTMPLPIPTGRAHTQARKYVVAGTFCGLPCALRYTEIHGGHNAEEQKLMLRQMAKDVFHMSDAFKAHAAGDAALLAAFGGPMSIEEFRAASNSAGVKMRTLTAPLVHAHMVVEQRGVVRTPQTSSMLCSAVRNISRPPVPAQPPTPNIRGQGLYEDYVKSRQQQSLHQQQQPSLHQQQPKPSQPRQKKPQPTSGGALSSSLEEGYPGHAGEHAAKEHAALESSSVATTEPMPQGGTQQGATQHGAMQQGATQQGAMQHGATQHGAMQQGLGFGAHESKDPEPKTALESRHRAGFKDERRLKPQPPSKHAASSHGGGRAKTGGGIRTTSLSSTPVEEDTLMQYLL